MNIDGALAKALGRVPTPRERQVLAGLMEAFQIRENDGILPVVATLMQIEASYRQYPERMGQILERFEKVLDAQLPSPAPARRGQAEVETRRALYWVTLAGVATTYSVLLGSLGMVVGAALSTGRQPCWVATGALKSVAANLLGAPAGWIVVLMLSVPAVYAAAWGWTRGRDVRRNSRERFAGWGALTAIGLALLGWLLLLSRLPKG